METNEDKKYLTIKTHDSFLRIPNNMRSVRRIIKILEIEEEDLKEDYVSIPLG